jgi:hypothetical protein
MCFHCNKQRCIFSREKGPEYKDAAVALQQKLESIDFRYSCGDLIFADNSAVGQVITQRQQLTCESRIEKAYYNTDERALDLTDICIHCGNRGSKDFLLCQEELETRNMTGGKQCYPICIACIQEKKKPFAYPKKKTNTTQKRKEAQATKAATQAARAAKKSKK